MKPSKRLPARLTAATARMLNAARDREGPPRLLYCGKVRLFCENPDCAVRHVIVHIKELPGEETLRGDLQCPACRNILNPHAVLTAEEASLRASREARCLVNVERFKRDHAETAGAPVAVPLKAPLDERLPA